MRTVVSVLAVAGTAHATVDCTNIFNVDVSGLACTDVPVLVTYTSRANNWPQTGSTFYNAGTGANTVHELNVWGCNHGVGNAASYYPSCSPNDVTFAVGDIVVYNNIALVVGMLSSNLGRTFSFFPCGCDATTTQRCIDFTNALGYAPASSGTQGGGVPPDSSGGTLVTMQKCLAPSPPPLPPSLPPPLPPLPPPPPPQPYQPLASSSLSSSSPSPTLKMPGTGSSIEFGPPEGGICDHTKPQPWHCPWFCLLPCAAAETLLLESRDANHAHQVRRPASAHSSTSPLPTHPSCARRARWRCARRMAAATRWCARLRGSRRRPAALGSKMGMRGRA